MIRLFYNKMYAVIVLALLINYLLIGTTIAAEHQKASNSGAEQSANYARLNSNELTYHVLLAEIAARRGLMDEALRNYSIAARGSDDARLAQRATNLALYVNDENLTLELAQRWFDLASNAGADNDDSSDDSLRARQALIIALLRNKSIDPAVEHLEVLRANAAQDPQEGFATVSALLGQIRDKDVIFATMESLSARHSQSQYALYYFALAATGLEKYSLAIENLNAALALAPQWRDALLLRAQTKIRQGNSDAALAELDVAVAEQPEERDLRLGYARLLVTADRLEQAREQFEILAEQDPNDVDSLYALGLLAADAKQYPVARKYLQQVLDLGKRQLEVYFELGKIEEQEQNYALAQTWYEKVNEGDRYLTAQVRAAAMLAKQHGISRLAERMQVLRSQRRDDVVRLYIAEADILREEGFYQQAFAKLSEALQERAGDTDLLYARALAAEKINKLDVLEADLRQILAADPENGHALNALGYTLADRTDRYQEALSYLQKAIKLLPGDAAVLDSMGWVKYRLGEHQESLEYLRRAYELNDDPEIVAHLSEVLWVMGNYEEAREIWQRSFDDHPDNEFLMRIKERFALDD